MRRFEFPNQMSFYQGKVRDVYSIDNRWLVMIASDRISAFDVILPRLIPYKGQVLNQLAAYMLDATGDICSNWLKCTPTANSAIGYKCEPYLVEVVVRGNLCGHAWRNYQAGKRVLCGAPMPDGMAENDFFPEPVITPSTKASQGHDEDITEDEIIRRGLVSSGDWEMIREYALRLFDRGRQMATERGLILADTKYEFGHRDGRILLMDEIHTPDSSRYFYREGFEERQKAGEKQKQLSKEFVREWLIGNGFMGQEGQEMPEMPDHWVSSISARYIELYEKVTGRSFVPEELDEEEIYNRIIEKLIELR